MKNTNVQPGTSPYFGLFGYVNSGEIKNVRVTNSSVIIKNDNTTSSTIGYYGNIAGYVVNANASVKKCYASPNFTINDDVKATCNYGRIVGGLSTFAKLEYYKICDCTDINTCRHLKEYVGITEDLVDIVPIELTNNSIDNKYNVIQDAILGETDIYVKFRKVTSAGTVIDMISTKEPTTYVKAGEKIRVEFAFKGYLKINDGKIKTIANAVNNAEGNIVNSNLLPKVTLNTPPGLICTATPIQVLEGVNTEWADVFSYNPITVLIYEYDTINDDVEDNVYLHDGERDLTANIYLGVNNVGQSVNMMYSTTNDGNWDEANLLNNTPTYTFKSLRKDLKAPGLTIKAYPETERNSGRYGDNEKIFVEVTSSEKLLSTTQAPEIELSFSKTGVADVDSNEHGGIGLENKVALLNSDGTRTWRYSYCIDGMGTTMNEGLLEVRLAEGTITDIAGNETDVSAINPVTFENIYADTTSPKAEITSQKIKDDGTYENIVAGTKTNADKIKYTITFDEQVGFNYSHLNISGGTLDETSFTGPVENNGSYIYTVEATTEDNAQNCILTIASGQFNDSANHTNLESTMSIGIDKEAKLTITADPEGPTNAESITYTFTFNESVEGFTKDDIKVDNGTIGEFTTIDSSKYTLVVTNGEYEACEQTVSVVAGVCSDSAQNGNTAASLTIKVDRILPTLEITADKEGKTNEESITYTFTFSEDVEGFTEDDITVLSGTKGEFTGSGKVYTLVVTNTGSCEQKISVAENACTDAAGNSNTKDEIAVEIDRTAPTLEITADKQSPTNAKSITYTFTFSEEVEEFTKDDIIVTNGTKGQFTDNGNIYTLVVTDGKNGEQTVSVAADVCEDLVGNKNTTGASKTIVINRAAPTATITYSPETLTNQDVTATITFDKENVTITGDGGKNTHVFKENGEFIFTYEDSDGNVGTAKAEVDWIDKTAPTATITFVTNADGSITATLGNFSEENVTITNNDGKNTYVFTSNGNFTFTFKDEAGNQGTAIATVTDISTKEPEIVFNENTEIITKDGKSYVRIQLGNTAEDLIAKMNSEALAGETPEFKNLTNDGKLKTGSTITLDGETKHIIVIKGDVNGDGKIEFSSDIIRANNIRLGIVNASAIEQILAADINNDGKIEFTKDIIKINNYRLGLINSL